MREFLHRRKAGQTLVLFALSFTVLFGLMAVAIEGGMMFVDRRQLQNAADASALAGAYSLETLPLPTYQTANQNALQVLVDNLPGTTMPGTIPTSGSFTQSLGSGYSATVTATGASGWDTYQVSVSHVFSLQLGTGLGFANPTLRASAKAQSGTFPFALILLQNDLAQYDNNSAVGNGSLELLKASGATAGGGGFSNEGFNIGTGGSASMTFSPCGAAGDLWAVSEYPASATNLAARTTGETGDSTCSTHPASYPKLQTTPLPVPIYPEPSVTGTSYASAISLTSGTSYLCPGTYSANNAIAMSSSPTLVLLPGVYRFTGSNAISISGGTLRSATSADYGSTSPYNLNAGTTYNCSATPTRPADGDYGVIIEMQPTGCGTTANQLTMSGGSSNLDIAPSPKYNKISLYIEYYPAQASWHTTCPFGGSGHSGTAAGTHAIKITGSAAYSIRGAIYGPGENATLAGNGAGYGIGQAILWTVSIAGNGALKENYDPAYLPYFRGLIQ